MPNSFTSVFYRTFKEDIANYIQTVSRTAKNGTLSNLFYEANKIVMPKSDMDISRREHDRIVLVIKMQKIMKLGNHIQQCLKWLNVL